MSPADEFLSQLAPVFSTTVGKDGEYLVLTARLANESFVERELIEPWDTDESMDSRRIRLMEKMVDRMRKYFYEREAGQLGFGPMR